MFESFKQAMQHVCVTPNRMAVDLWLRSPLVQLKTEVGGALDVPLLR